MENSILLKRLKDNAEEKIISFHMPGHKNGQVYNAYEDVYGFGKIGQLDVTEIEGTDNLHAPEGVIKEAQEKAASFFKADHTFFIVNGTSSANISALMSVVNPNDQVIVPRDCHKSITNAMILGGIIPVYISPEIDPVRNISMGVKPEIIEQTILENPNIKAVVITYPNYYGVCSDIEEISKIVHKYNKVLIVDEAHGAHFGLSDELPMSSMEAGADIVCQSIHKTLPSFTQSSMLHVKGDRINLERLKFMLTMHQSSSPSYLLMTSLDVAREIAQSHGKRLMNNLLNNIKYFSNEIEDIDGIELLDANVIGKYEVKNIDLTRLVIDMTKLGLSGVQLEALLRNEYSIQMEMSDTNHIVAIATIGNTRDDFESLLQALLDIKSKHSITFNKIYQPLFYANVPKVRLSPRDAVFRNKKDILFENSVGEISGEYIIPYPPGIPIICPGEEITKEIIERVKSLRKKGINIIGMNDEYFMKIKVIE